MGQTFSAKANPVHQTKEVDIRDKGIEKDVVILTTRKQGVENSNNAKDEEKHVLSQVEGKRMYSDHFQRTEQIQEVGLKDNEKHVLKDEYIPNSFQRTEQIQEVGLKDNEKHVLKDEYIPNSFQRTELEQPGKYVNKVKTLPTRKQIVEDDSINKVEIPTNKEVFETKHREVAMNNESLSMNMWLKHYNDCQRILFVGDGDFSFSASLVVAFGSSCSNITATSHCSADYLRSNYTKAIENIENLTCNGATVMLRLDPATMANHPYLRLMKFDRIIYNIPYFGFTRDTPKFQKRKQTKLVKGFLSNAKKMVKEDGEIHISHQTNGFHLDWDIVNQLALLEGLCLDRRMNFNLSDYPAYAAKYGGGGGGDNNFDSSQCKTYMWRIVVSTRPLHYLCA